jgi:hypothetical protein
VNLYAVWQAKTFSYVVEYYYEGETTPFDKVTISNQPNNTIIDNVADSNNLAAGYERASVDSLPATITNNDTVIKVTYKLTEIPARTIPFKFTKVKASDDTLLQGAKFNLYACNETASESGSHTHSDYDPNTVNTVSSCWVSVNESPVVSDNNGLVDFGDIPSGDYLLREIEAPSGYERSLGWWVITVDADDEDNPIESITGAGPSLPPAFMGTFAVGSGLELPNYEKTVLPLTGSVPADLTIAATMFLGIAALLFATGRKRKPARDTGAAMVSMRSTISDTAAEAVSTRPTISLKKLLKCILLGVLAIDIIFMALLGTAATAFAAEPPTGSITVHRYAPDEASSDVSKLPTEGKPLQGIPFKVEKVIVAPTPATTGDVVYSFDGKSYVLDGSGAYPARTLATNRAGEVVFSGLPLGIYLVSEQSITGAAAPLLVGIPTAVPGTNDPALFDIDVYPKPTVTPPPEDPEIDDDPIIPPSDPRPGTGIGMVLGSFDETNAWSLLSLIMSVTAVIASLVLIISQIFRRRRGDGDQRERRNAFIMRALTIIIGIAILVVFLILDDMNLPMVLINKWTLYVGLAFVIYLVLLIIYNLRDKKGDDPYEAKESS